MAFPSPDDATVRRFHAAALAAGYRDNGAPGERQECHPGYFGAFVLDPAGATLSWSATTAADASLGACPNPRRSPRSP